MEPASLADALEELSDKLAQALPEAQESHVHQIVANCLARLRRVCTGLRAMALVLEPERAKQLARREEDLRSIVGEIGHNIRGVAEANRDVAEQMAAQVEELDGIADLPPSKELADRLRNTVTSVREATTKMDRNLGELVSRVDSANARIAALEKELNEARERALYDSLTRVYSRAALDERLAIAVRQGETKGPWSFLIADIDYFKAVNDKHGHIVGDALLYKIARVMEKTLNGRVGDAILARYGGEEFSAILPRSILPKATQVAELLRRTVEASRWQCRTASGNAVVQTTVSFGVAQYRDGDTAVSLVERADRALYEAKEGGRNRVAASQG